MELCAASDDLVSTGMVSSCVAGDGWCEIIRCVDCNKVGPDLVE